MAGRFAAQAPAASRRPLQQGDWVAPLLAVARNATNVANGGVGAAALLGLLGWIALSIHEMNARLGVVETRLIAVEEGQEKLEAGQEKASAERQIDDLARRLPRCSSAARQRSRRRRET